jgi:hypothetical protein
MITLKNGTKEVSPIGYLAKIATGKDGYFELAGIGEDVCGVISESVPPNSVCKIITDGEALVHLHKKAYVGNKIRQQLSSDGARKGSCLPFNGESGANIVAMAVESGRGLIRANVTITSNTIFGPTGASYGSMYNHDVPTTVTITIVSTPTQVPSGYSEGSVNNMVFQNSREIKALSDGYYFITWSIAFTAASANQEIEGSIMVNGVVNNQFSSHRKISTGTDTGSMGGNGIISLNKGDLVSACVTNETSTANVVVEHSNLSVVQVG